MFNKKMKIHFGPNISYQVKTVLHYATIVYKNNECDHVINTYDEDDNTLFTFIKEGEIICNDVTVNIVHTSIVHALETSMVTEVYGYFEAETFDIIKFFFEKASEYTKNKISLGREKNQIKVLNFDYRWECDCLINKKSFNSIHLPSKILTEFRNDIETFLSPETKKKYENLELSSSRIYGLYGPPGTGKTTLIHTIASHMSMNIATISFDNQMNDRAFKNALKKLPIDTILCLEDIDALFMEDRKASESCITFSGIINSLDGVFKIKNVIIFLTTNHLQKLDPALKRRIDYFIKFDFSTKEQIKDMFKRFLPNENFETFWKVCLNLKITPNILQKFFIKNLSKKFDDYVGNFKEFVEGEHGLEKTLDMYT
jgi:hypothetical protein